MTIRLYADEFRCAIYDEAPGGGDPLDPNALMNRPVVNPMGWLSSLYFHSNFDYYGAPFHGTVTIGHAAVAGASSQVAYFTTFEGQAVRSDHLLLTHNLGYVPRFFVHYGNLMIPHGMPVQDEGEGLKRFVTGYATSTQVRLSELAWSGASTLSAASRTYGAVVFANSEANPFLDQLLIEPGHVIFGRGRFNVSWPHLRVVGSGESPYAQALGRTAGVGNGSLRVITPGGGAINFGPYVDKSGLVAPSFINVTVGR
jgi:hypothetical protein